jgi:hypothetical protein
MVDRPQRFQAGPHVTSQSGGGAAGLVVYRSEFAEVAAASALRVDASHPSQVDNDPFEPPSGAGLSALVGCTRLPIRRCHGSDIETPARVRWRIDSCGSVRRGALPHASIGTTRLDVRPARRLRAHQPGGPCNA